MSNTLTITITNLPEAEIETMWSESTKEFSKSLFGLEIPRTDNIQIDYDVIKQVSDDSVAAVLGGAIASHALMVVHQKMTQTVENQKP